MKRNKTFYEATKKQFETLLPEDMKADWLKALDICFEKVDMKIKNACDLAMAMGKCFYENNPKFSF